MSAYKKVVMRKNPKQRLAANADAPPYMKNRTVKRQQTVQAWKKQLMEETAFRAFRHGRNSLWKKQFSELF